MYQPGLMGCWPSDFFQVDPFTMRSYGCTQDSCCKSLTPGHIFHYELHTYRSMGINNIISNTYWSIISSGVSVRYRSFFSEIESWCLVYQAFITKSVSYPVYTCSIAILHNIFASLSFGLSGMKDRGWDIMTIFGQIVITSGKFCCTSRFCREGAG
jgi:hypothetical protein